MFKNNRKRMGYGVGVKLGYHLLKHLKRQRWFGVHMPELFWAIARLFSADIFRSNAPFDTRRARDKSESHCFDWQRLILSAYVTYTHTTAQSVHWKSSFTVQVFLRTNQNADGKKRQEKQWNNGLHDGTRCSRVLHIFNNTLHVSEKNGGPANKQKKIWHTIDCYVCKETAVEWNVLWSAGELHKISKVWNILWARQSHCSAPVLELIRWTNFSPMNSRFNFFRVQVPNVPMQCGLFEYFSRLEQSSETAFVWRPEKNESNSENRETRIGGATPIAISVSAKFIWGWWLSM